MPFARKSSTAQKDRPDLLTAFADEFSKRIRKPADDDLVWRFKPPHLDEFVASKQYLDQPPLSPRQREKILEALGEDPTKVFDGTREIVQLVLMWGKGSGKDWISSIVLSYLCTIVLAMRDATGYFGFPHGEPLDMINVARSAAQAKNVYFEKLKQRLGRPFFQQFHPVVNDGYIEFPDMANPIPGRRGEYTPLIRIFSGHSQQDSQEGYNLLAWVMDEADAFRDKEGHSNAEGIHSMLRSSARTRFGKRWVGIVISYPRRENGFMVRTYAEALGSAEMMADKAATWDVHPTAKRSDFDEDYRVDPDDAAQKYECIPMPVEMGFFREHQRIDEAVDWNRKPLAMATVSTTVREVHVTDPHTMEVRVVTREFVALQLSDWLKSNAVSYYIHGDPGLSDASYALAVSHPVGAEERIIEVPEAAPPPPLKYGELPPGMEVRMGRIVPIKGWRPPSQQLADHSLVITDEEGNELQVGRVSVDLLLVWKPTHGKPVDMLNVGDTIIEICKALPVRKVTFDRWNSADIIQKIIDRTHVPAEDLTYTNAEQLGIYKMCRTLIYAGMVTMCGGPWMKDAVQQLRTLRLLNGSIKPPEDAVSKDIADAIATAIWHSAMPGAVRRKRTFTHV